MNHPHVQKNFPEFQVIFWLSNFDDIEGVFLVLVLVFLFLLHFIYVMLDKTSPGYRLFRAFVRIYIFVMVEIV